MLIRSAPGTGPALPELHHRLRWLVVVVAVAFLILVGRLWQLQVVRGDQYLEEALSNVVQKRFISSVRGKILDRVGRPLATNRPAFNIYVSPDHFKDAVPELVRLLGLSSDEQAEMKDNMDDARKRRARAPVLLLSDQGAERATLVEQASYRMPGVSVHYVPYRDYPYGSLASHVIGYMNKMRPKEYEKYRQLGYDEDELIGRDGIEAKLENELRGKKGEERFVVNARGQRVEGAEAARLIDGPAFTEPVAGHDVVLTLDLELQKAAERAVRNVPAAGVVVVEVRTGRILAMVSTPSPDSNVMTGRLTAARKAELDADPRQPFVDKTLQQHYPPGSTYKFVTAIAGLDDDVITPDEIQTCPGSYEVARQVFHCTSAHGKMDMRHALQHSCNVYFWKLAEKVGMDRMAEVAFDFGFGHPTGLGLNGDLPGRVPTKDWYRQHGDSRIGNTLNMATGQGDVEVTVTQLAMAYAALANGGDLYVPQIIRQVQDGAGEVLFSYAPKLRHHVKASPEALQVVHEGMDMVVNQLGGTAYEHARSDFVHFAGKTGTAEVRGRKHRRNIDIDGWHPYGNHAWFAGYAPAEDPEIAIAVLVEHGGHGGAVAAPVARDIFEAYFRDVKPAYEKAMAEKKGAAK